MNDFKNIIETNVLKDIIVSSFIQNKFYFGQLATIKDTKFPCANFDITGGSLVSRISEFQELPFSLWSWSGTSKEEAWNIYEAIFNVINNQSLSNDINNKFITVKELVRPIFNYDNSDDQQLYYYMGRWEAFMLKSNS